MNILGLNIEAIIWMAKSAIGGVFIALAFCILLYGFLLMVTKNMKNGMLIFGYSVILFGIIYIVGVTIYFSSDDYNIKEYKQNQEIALKEMDENIIPNLSKDGNYLSIKYRQMIFNNVFNLEKDKYILLKLIKDNDNFKQYFPDFKNDFSLLTVNQQIVFTKLKTDNNLIQSDIFLEEIKNSFDYSSNYLFVLSKDNGDGVMCLSVGKDENNIKNKIEKTDSTLANVEGKLNIKNNPLKLNNLIETDEYKIITQHKLNLNNLIDKNLNLNNLIDKNSILAQNTIKKCKEIKLKNKKEILNLTKN